MKNYHLFFLVIIAVLLVSPYAHGETKDDEKANVTLLSQELNKAVESRNFQSAREIVDQILPLMKKQLKLDKKTLTELNKSENSDVNPADYKRDLSTKNKLYEDIQTLINSSPAALRVKSEVIVSKVEEFVRLSA